MTAAGGGPRRGGGLKRPVWQPDWTWRMRQVTCLLVGSWFVGLVPLVIVTGMKYGAGAVAWVGFAWLAVLLACAAVVELVGGRIRRRWQTVATQRGWQVQPSVPELARRWPFPPFDLDPSPDVLHVTSGEHRGRRFWTGLFMFRIGRQPVGFCFTDIEIHRPLPPMQVAPESLVGLVAPGLRPLDLHLESGEFNARYRLVRGEPSLVHAVLNPRAMEAMLAVQPFGWVSQDDRFVLLAPGSRRPETVISQLDAGCDVLDLIPELVWTAGADWRTHRR